MIEPAHLREVVTGTLEIMADVAGEPRLASPAAVELLLMTAAHESQCGRYLWQVGGGPAIGIYQHERRTVRDVARYMERSRTLENVAGLFYADIPDVPSNIALQWQIATNLSLATVYARAHYWRVSEALPAVDDVVGLAAYAKRHWNTSAGKATVDDYAQAYRCYFKTGTGDLAYL